MKISEIMSSECKWLPRNATVKEAARIMRDQDFGFLPVGCTDMDKLVGTITDRDICLKVVAEGRDPEQVSVEEIMTENVLYCYDDEDVNKVCDNMSDIRVRRLPVVNRDKRLVGVVSFGDLSQGANDKKISATQQEITRECAQDDRRAA